MRKETLAGHPTVTVGNGPNRLLIIPGLNDPLMRVTETFWFARIVAAYCNRYAANHTVSMVSRPVGVETQSTEEMADGYAAVLEETGPAAVMGLSMGGFIVQHLAAARPDLVTGAILGLSAAKLSDAGHETIARWRDWGRANQWNSIYCEAVDAVATGLLRRGFSLGARGYDFVTRGPRTPADFIGAAEACLAHDATELLPEIEVPTLTVGGTADPFFAERDFRETAERLGGEGEILLGIGHEAVIHHAAAFDEPINCFLGRGAQF
ncbi:alpha/beta hydrolase [Haladaptatus sp. DJG-WS-42]|uniref:alpha/beta fold hydrolase n=1 Tax=Haladaptatus sp. DJG-WS-42 TaxID=3120516 RepID=UPI0030D59D3B